MSAQPGPFEWTRTVRAYLLAGMLVALFCVGWFLLRIERHSGSADSGALWRTACGVLPAYIAFALVLGVVEAALRDRTLAIRLAAIGPGLLMATLAANVGSAWGVALVSRGPRTLWPALHQVAGWWSEGKLRLGEDLSWFSPFAVLTLARTSRDTRWRDPTRMLAIAALSGVAQWVVVPAQGDGWSSAGALIGYLMWVVGLVVAEPRRRQG